MYLWASKPKSNTIKNLMMAMPTFFGTYGLGHYLFYWFTHFLNLLTFSLLTMISS